MMRDAITVKLIKYKAGTDQYYQIECVCIAGMRVCLSVRVCGSRTRANHLPVL